MTIFPVSLYNLSAIHERACKAILATGRTQREVAMQMGIDVDTPMHKRKPLEPTLQNIQKAAQILGVSEKWLIYGVPETQLDLYVSKPMTAFFYGQNIIVGNNNSSIEISNKKSPCATCIHRKGKGNN